MAESPVYRVRIEDRLKALIDADRGALSVSAWLRRAAAQRIEAAQGLGPEFGAHLAEHNAQLRAIGGNLNQLARAANERRPVVVDLQMLHKILDEIRAARSLLNEVNSRLPE